MLLFIFFVQINYFKPLLGLSIIVKRLLYNYLVATLNFSEGQNIKKVPYRNFLKCSYFYFEKSQYRARAGAKTWREKTEPKTKNKIISVPQHWIKASNRYRYHYKKNVFQVYNQQLYATMNKRRQSKQYHYRFKKKLLHSSNLFFICFSEIMRQTF